jgi:hypothetical protein
MSSSLEMFDLIAITEKLGPIAVDARPNAWAFGRVLAGIVGSNPTGCMDVCLLLVVCCQVEVSASD